MFFNGSTVLPNWKGRLKCDYCNKELPLEHEEDKELMSVCKDCFNSYLDAIKEIK